MWFEAMLHLLATITTGYPMPTLQLQYTFAWCYAFRLERIFWKFVNAPKKEGETKRTQTHIGLFFDFVFMCRKTMAGCSSIIFLFVCDSTLYLLLLAITSALVFCYSSSSFARLLSLPFITIVKLMANYFPVGLRLPLFGLTNRTQSNKNAFCVRTLDETFRLIHFT